MTALSLLRRLAAHRLVTPALVTASVLMIVVGKADQAIFEPIRISLTDNTAPVLAILSRPLAIIGDITEHVQMMVDLYQDNLRLNEENQRLMHWQQAALNLADENRELRRLLKLVPQNARSFVSARVIATSGGAYLRNLMIDAGSDNGIARGQAVVAGDGLVGRIYDVGAHAARVLLITDLNSRIPVILERLRQRAILTGDNSSSPLLRYVDPAAPVTAGDRLVTSGEGGVFPPGLPVGIVAGGDPTAPRVHPYVDPSQVEFVRIVDYGLAKGLPNPPASGHSLPHPGSMRIKARRY